MTTLLHQGTYLATEAPLTESRLYFGDDFAALLAPGTPNAIMPEPAASPAYAPAVESSRNLLDRTGMIPAAASTEVRVARETETANLALDTATNLDDTVTLQELARGIVPESIHGNPNLVRWVMGQAVLRLETRGYTPLHAAPIQMYEPRHGGAASLELEARTQWIDPAARSLVFQLGRYGAFHIDASPDQAASSAN